VENAIDRRWTGVGIFLGWLFILEREDEWTSISGTGTPLKGAGCLPTNVVRGTAGTSDRTGGEGVSTLARAPGRVILDVGGTLSVAIDRMRGMSGTPAFGTGAGASA
jgi:hypothetical protein